jgi:hypothetical protein
VSITMNALPTSRLPHYTATALMDSNSISRSSWGRSLVATSGSTSINAPHELFNAAAQKISPSILTAAASRPGGHQLPHYLLMSNTLERNTEHQMHAADTHAMSVHLHSSAAPSADPQTRQLLSLLPLPPDPAQSGVLLRCSAQW